AHVYLPSGEQLPDERWHVGGIVQGGFALAKGAVEGLYEALGLVASFQPADDLPGGARGARTPDGWVLALREPGLPGEWGAFEPESWPRSRTGSAPSCEHKQGNLR